MNWNKLEKPEDLGQILEKSKVKPVLIFKHSTRCSISSTALNRVERAWNDTFEAQLEPWYLDLLNYRPISNQIATDLGVQHESPQALLIKDGRCIYSATHFDIQLAEIMSLLN